jgi:flagellar hook-basal body complex protein FliE
MPHIPSLSSLPIAPKPDLSESTGASSGGGDAFRALLQQSVAHVSQLQSDSEAAVGKFLGGEQEDPHTMMLSVQRASLAFDMFVQVRNKVVSAYQEVMKMSD